jgi:uncharacterized protein
MIPKRETCLKILRENKVPEHIINHSLTVEKVALFIAREINVATNRDGNKLNYDLISAGALLHDIAKIKAIEKGEHHGELGGKMVKEMGFPKVADSVKQHIRLDSYDKMEEITEVEVINYADKRVTHDIVVSMSERFSDIRHRYGKGSRIIFARIEKSRKLTLIIEERIFEVLPFKPDDLLKQMESID